MQRIGDFFAIVVAVVRMLYWKVWRHEPRWLNHNYGPRSYGRFMSAMDAVRYVKSGDRVVVCGLGGTGWCPAIFKAIVKLFQRTGSPHKLIILVISGQGDRGNDLGSIDRLAKHRGIVAEFFTGHLETFKETIKAALRGELELVCIPQGTFSRWLKLAAQGVYVIRTKVGLGTFADPNCGQGTKVGPGKQQWVVNAGGELCYDLSERTPNVVIIYGTCADLDGNISVKHCPLREGMKTAVAAVRKNKGLVIVQVGYYVDRLPEDEIYIPGRDVRFIVVRPETPTTFCFTQRWPLWSEVLGAKANIERCLKIDAWLNWFSGLTPKRTEADQRLGRIAAWWLSRLVKPGAVGNIGVGQPELAGYWLKQGGVMNQLNVVVETGPGGGTPATGPMFGCVHGMTSIQESPNVFAMFEAGIDFAFFGAAQVGANGDVNASLRGGVLVGPGGLQSIAEGAKIIIVMMREKDKRSGRPRFVRQVDEVTLSAKQALAAGKTIYYVTESGIFMLFEGGLQLVCRPPDKTVDEICRAMSANVTVTAITPGIEVLPENVMTGKDFLLELAA